MTTFISKPALKTLRIINREDKPSVRETEAEAVAFAVAKIIGLVTGTHRRITSTLYHGTVSLLAESLEVI